jgi:hypothetical protein
VIDPRDRGRIEPLIVAALVNRNEAVFVIDTLDDHRSISFINMTTCDRSPRSLARRVRRRSSRYAHDIDLRSRLHRRTACDRIVLGFVGSRCPAATFSDVQRNSLCGATKVMAKSACPWASRSGMRCAEAE